MKILVTGSSGFIGFHTSLRLLDEGHDVHGIDCENNYYDVNLKESRRQILLDHESNSFTFHKLDLSSDSIINEIELISPDYIIHLAAQAGVRHSLEYPQDYTKNNITAFTNILEFSKSNKSLRHLVFASTSSVYGANSKLPFSEDDPVDHPLQYYAVTKRANELMAHSYANLFNIRATGVRFFTVYGPWGRPDMALFLFTKNILEGKLINVFNNGNHQRDFTYVDDIVSGILIALFDDQFISSSEPGGPSNSFCNFRLLNIGRGKPIALSEFINAIEKKLNLKAKKNFLPMQLGDVPSSHACIKKIKKLGYKPRFNFEQGVENFIDWYLDFYQR
ncbi:NAD-dependent epimerase/dehydratase family protein [Gammaproteobacteria bacterium]|nr:NAD-dependent epimerase/dehydratase family protein [Gammaproteobacteria bacterium]